MRLCMIYVLLFLLSFSLSLAGTYFYSRPQLKNEAASTNTPTPTPSITAFDLNKAPSLSLKGDVIELAGEVRWQSRIATEAGRLMEPIEIKQQEALETGEDGRVTIVFSGAAQIELSSNSTVEFIQTLPGNIVVSQKQGTVTYSQLHADIPLTVRWRHLLVKIEGTAAISQDTEEPLLMITPHEGVITAAYNDLDLKSNVISLESGSTLIFDDETRMYEVSD